MKKKYLWWVLAGVIVVGASWGPIVSQVEQAKYEVVETHGNIEIRDYAPMIVAETEVSGEREQAIEEGFRLIADYIFGNNSPAEKVAMTAPVIQQESTQIAMTAPVIQQGNGTSWNVRFVMPSSYSLESLPKPNNHAVKITQEAGKRFVVIRFSGIGKGENLKRHTDELNRFIEEKKLKPISAPIYAFFNPPWTLPFLRRNEVMIEIES